MYTPFLRQVAQYFHGKENIHDYCFVMPNHRSCKFFERELDITSHGVFLMPEVMSITDFVSRLTHGVVVSPVEALFLLYKCYIRLSGNELYPFDKFAFWGNIVLNDFNDVDMYLVNSEEIFKNVEEHREIQSNYLDGDLQELLAQYFDMSAEAGAVQEQDFWRNYTTPTLDKEQVRAEYLRLWQSLNQLYEDYNQELQDRGLCSVGRLYRNAVDVVKDGTDLGHRCYVFVGFNMLSTSEMAIFKRLGNRKKAMFFWDTASPAFGVNYPENTGGRFVNFFKRQFPEPSDYCSETINAFPNIEVIGVPSNVGQVKCAFNTIDNLVDNGEIADSLNAIDTAVVLPDEALFVPMLNSLSPKVPNINVTMSYPLRSSDMASLMRVVAKMHRQSRRNDSGEWCFYRSDVKVLLSHPIIKTCYGDEALAVIQKIDAENMFAVPQSLVRGLPFDMLFKCIDRVDDVNDVVNFLRQLVEFCNNVLAVVAPPPVEMEDEEDNQDESQEIMLLQEAFINQYVEVLERLIDAIRAHQVPFCEGTVFFLVDRLASVFSIPFEGEPLHGLQVMGMLETRCLDFNNVIILSANERILPRKFRTSSFISDFMRRGYGMSTVADQESMWAYYFYRLIGRARNVYLFYDTSSQALGSSEVTRYVQQLKMIYGCEVKEVNYTMPVPVSEEVVIDVPKQGRAAAILRSYLAGEGEKRLSASSINEFINCPLAFYLRHIEGLNADSAEADFMDYSVFGTVVHETLRYLYYPDINGKPREGEYKVTRAMIKEFEEKHLDVIVCRMVNKEYFHKPSSSEPLTGEASIVSVAIKMYVKAALKYDKEMLVGDNDYFTVLECERKHDDVVLEFGGKAFNFTFTADRIDRLTDGTLRIVDYKTGSDETSFETMDDLFVREDKRRKAILQLMLYCNAYAKETGYTGSIRPVIYTLKDMSQAGIKVKVGKNKFVDFDDYLSINEEFKERMGKVMNLLFDMSVPFGQTPSTKRDTRPCRYCKFVDFCRR